ncbi:hypothetical protein EVAR_82129_1 [Eumeta japonica]|uniref:Uncharacterized protein n=1 Tax=Eumeta variegata TaxID=151549 RepID=A0A4C1U345_EUMVA|nr:hypothetical protein EVAR_82129_1 [Eumeta japonica]
MILKKLSERYLGVQKSEIAQFSPWNGLKIPLACRDVMLSSRAEYTIYFTPSYKVSDVGKRSITFCPGSHLDKKFAFSPRYDSRSRTAADNGNVLGKAESKIKIKYRKKMFYTFIASDCTSAAVWHFMSRKTLGRSRCSHYAAKAGSGCYVGAVCGARCCALVLPHILPRQLDLKPPAPAHAEGCDTRLNVIAEARGERLETAKTHFSAVVRGGAGLLTMRLLVPRGEEYDVTFLTTSLTLAREEIQDLNTQMKLIKVCSNVLELVQMPLVDSREGALAPNLENI